MAFEDYTPEERRAAEIRERNEQEWEEIRRADEEQWRRENAPDNSWKAQYARQHREWQAHNDLIEGARRAKQLEGELDELRSSMNRNMASQAEVDRLNWRLDHMEHPEWFELEPTEILASFGAFVKRDDRECRYRLEWDPRAFYDICGSEIDLVFMGPSDRRGKNRYALKTNMWPIDRVDSIDGKEFEIVSVSDRPQHIQQGAEEIIAYILEQQEALDALREKAEEERKRQEDEAKFEEEYCEMVQEATRKVRSGEWELPFSEAVIWHLRPKFNAQMIEDEVRCNLTDADWDAIDSRNRGADPEMDGLPDNADLSIDDLDSLLSEWGINSAYGGTWYWDSYGANYGANCAYSCIIEVDGQEFVLEPIAYDELGDPWYSSEMAEEILHYLY